MQHQYEMGFSTPLPPPVFFRIQSLTKVEVHRAKLMDSFMSTKASPVHTDGSMIEGGVGALAIFLDVTFSHSGNQFLHFLGQAIGYVNEEQNY